MTRYESESGPVFTGAHRLHQDKFAVLPFESKRHSTVPLIEARMRGERGLPVLIDLSSPVSWIEYDTATRLGLIPLGPPGVRRVAAHVDDQVLSYLAVASRVTLDTVHVETALFYVRAARGSIGPLARGQKELETPAVLGAEFVRAFHFVQFDYPNRRVAFATSTLYQPNEDRLIASVPLRDLDGHLVLIALIGGQETPVLLDTLGDFSFAGNFIDHGTQLRQLALGDLVLRQIPVTDITTTGLGMVDVPRIGRDILSRFIITIDGRRRLVHFERPD